MFWRRLSTYCKALVVKMKGQSLGESADLHLQKQGRQAYSRLDKVKKGGEIKEKSGELTLHLSL